MYPTAGQACEGPEIGTYILWPHTVAVDALAIGRQLHEAADDLLVPLLLPPAPHISTG